MMDRQKTNLKEIIVLFVFFIIVVGILFHTQIETKFDVLIGERLDGIIETSILQHWYNTFSGKSHWNDVGYFYPYHDTLGYNDGYFLYGVMYSIFKAFGFDMFISSELVNLTLKGIGYFSLYLLCRHHLKVKFWYALAGALIFTFANSLAIQIQHAQLLSIVFSPLLTYLILSYFHYLAITPCRKKAILNGSLSGLLLSGWLITTFYMAWFYILFSLTLLIIFSIFSLSSDNFRSKLDFLKNISFACFLIPLSVFIITSIPFLMVYLPKIHETGGQLLESALVYAPSIGNILDPGSKNLLFGSIADYLYHTFFPNVNRTGEFRIGFPPLSLITIVISLVYFWKRKYVSLIKLFCFSLSLSILVSILLIIKLDGRSLWEIVWYIIPGAKGMRVTARYALFLIFPLSVLIVLFLSDLKSKIPTYVLISFAILLILEQINLSPNQQLYRQQQITFIKSIPKPPSSCRVFFVTGQRAYENSMLDEKNFLLNLYPHNVDAMLISELFALRTLNGFSTFNPPDWDFKLYPYASYANRVLSYAKAHDIKAGLCNYDLYSSTWHKVDISNPLTMVRVKSDDITISLKNKPVLSNSEKSWHIEIKVTNNGLVPFGQHTFTPLNIGIRELDNNGIILSDNFPHVEIPYTTVHNSSTVIINIPKTQLQTSKIEILPLQENIAWLDAVGVKPIHINL